MKTQYQDILIDITNKCIKHMENARRKRTVTKMAREIGVNQSTIATAQKRNSYSLELITAVAGHLDRYGPFSSDTGKKNDTKPSRRRQRWLERQQQQSS